MADPYKIEFVWEKKSAQLKAARCDDKNVPNEDHWDGSIANQFVQVSTNEQQNACLTVNTTQVVRQTKGRFVYLDVGGWVNNKQTFGLVWGNQAVLCSYSPSAATPAPGSGNLLEEFLKLPGVSKINQLWIDGPNTNDWNMIHVILPDTHVPVSPPPGFPRPPEDPKRWNSLTGGAWDADPRAWDLYAKRDLFNSRDSVPAMTQFLNLLASIKFARQIHLTQVGDMYELWAGRPCYFTGKASGPPGVALNDPRGAKEVGGWIADTHEFFPDLYQGYDRCVSSLLGCKFIHGNHDSYCSVPEVITEANNDIDSRVAKPDGYMVRRKTIKTTVHPREASGNVFDRGLFIEHGQRCDGYNGDGNRDGWDKTQSAFKVGQRTPFDSTRRPSFVTGAAALWLTRGQDFGCYVMGHTHSPDLNYVEVTHRIIELDVKVGPRALPIMPKL